MLHDPVASRHSSWLRPNYSGFWRAAGIAKAYTSGYRNQYSTPESRARCFTQPARQEPADILFADREMGDDGTQLRPDRVFVGSCRPCRPQSAGQWVPLSPSRRGVQEGPRVQHARPSRTRRCRHRYHKPSFAGVARPWLSDASARHGISSSYRWQQRGADFIRGRQGGCFRSARPAGGASRDPRAGLKHRCAPNSAP